MSLLIPTNPSNAHKGKRKPDKSDYPTSIQHGEDAERELPDTRDQPKTVHNAAESDQLPRKRTPVPVTLVDLDPAQMDPDEYGAELGKEARVWKVYVQETDKWDRELVDGWNKSLDVILVFAALFSAVFLIESSAMLQQDPNEVSATALLAISQTLLVIANGSSVDLPTSTSSSPDPASSFSPSQHAVIVNSMLAKDWCHSFLSNRTGHPWDQALRRQRKWAMIEQWKMQELITVLPSLIHLSLLLFSIGLCLYVWDMNKTTAIPVVCVAGASFAFYVWCSSIASVVALFPYTTIVSRVIQSDFIHRQYALLKKYTKQWTIRTLSLISPCGYGIIVSTVTGCGTLVFICGLRAQDSLRNQRVEDDPETNSSKQTAGIEVMIWDLKAEHERQVVELISSTRIRTSDTSRSDEQQQQCQRLMSQSGFPKLDKYLNWAINEPIASRKILAALWDIYERSNSGLSGANPTQRFGARTRQLVATQFWLLLCLISDASTELQKDLRRKIQRDTRLELENRGVDSVKAELEEEIIQGYEGGHRFGLYSARIIECILQAWGASQDVNLFRRITRDLKDVPSNIRGLSSFLDQPVNPQSDPSHEHPPVDSSRASTPPAPDVQMVNQSNERIQSAETDSPLVQPSTHDPNTELPPSATPISTLPDAETDGATAESTVNHVAIPMPPDTTEPDHP
ncbi:hypothetical protein RSOLAG22IIIB_11023 [Rhizoctonia solani]|uniref:DUF6535 domain-containing protein n=1 Tax=Rhizoctonia solani TaxID=456999 RepID=A0A0K6G6D6_9AGAM|nr:hypothetical protein RSOLAG22IIIB_11023 [Rhizoctonia solani]